MAVFPKVKPLLPDVEARRAALTVACWLGAVAFSLLVTGFGISASHTSRYVAQPMPPNASVGVQALAQATPTLQAALPMSTEETLPPGTALSGQVVIWFAASLMPGEDTPGETALTGIISALERQLELDLTIRLKRAEGVGGIYQTLESAHTVAPSTIPDLVVVSSSEMSKIIRAKLAVTMNGDLTPEIDTILADLFDSGSVPLEDDGPYGLPFFVEIQHLVMQSEVSEDSPPDTFAEIAKRKLSFTFPVKAVNGVSASVLAHYSALGGRVRDESGSPILDRIPLIALLEGASSAAADKTILPEALTFTAPSQYWGQFTSGRIALAQVGSSLYLATLQSAPDIVMIPAPLPAFEGHAPLIVDGYWWLITTTDPARRAQAQSVIAWFMEPSRHAMLSEAMGMLPSRRESLKRWRNTSYARFAATILEGDPSPLPYTVEATLAAALQTAFEDVLSGRRTIPQAVDDALSAVE